MTNKKLHIVHTHPSNLGGVANHYRGLKDYWPITISTSLVGSRLHIDGSLFFIYDLFLMIIKSRNSSAVLLNPSMQRKAFWRDFILLLFLILLRKKVVIFFHGWDNVFANKVLKYKFVLKCLKYCKIITLATKFNNQLKLHGLYKLYLSSTKFDEKLLSCLNEKDETNSKFTILFVGRLIEPKGVQRILNSIAISNHKKKFKLIVAGDGPYKKNLIEHTHELGLSKSVNFAGYVRNCDLSKLYRASDLYVLPTSHNEGLPTTILEALAFGLPVITTAVGGISDVVSNNRNGLIIDDLNNPIELKKHIEFFYLNPELTFKFKLRNLKLSKKFSSSNVAKQITNIIFD